MIKEIEFPSESLLNGKASQCFYRDAYRFTSSNPQLEAKHIYHGIFGMLPKPAQSLMKVRNSIMRWFGFSTGDFDPNLALADIQVGHQAGFLVIESLTPEEVVSAAYDKNMDIWISVLKVSEIDYVVATLVNLKTKGGRVYLFIIKPFHKILVRHAIKHAMKLKRI